MVDEKWHLDKRVPISIIVTMLFQTGTVIWWASGVQHRMDSFESKIAELTVYNRVQDVKVETIQLDRTVNLQRLTRVEQSMSDIKDFMQRFDAKIDRLTESSRR